MHSLVTASILRAALAFAWLGIGSYVLFVAARRRRYVNSPSGRGNGRMKIANGALFAGGLICVGLGVYNVYRLFLAA